MLHLKQLRYQCLIAVALLLAAILPLVNADLIWKSLPFGILALAYVIPIKNGVRLRDFPFVKIFLVAGVWTYTTAVFPTLVTSSGEVTSVCNWQLYAHRFLFIYAITLPFDIRDLEQDSADGVKTVANTLGLKQLKLICYFLLVLSSLSLAIKKTDCFDLLSIAAITLSLIITAVIIANAKISSAEWYYSGLLESTMLIQAAIIALLTLN